MKEIIVSWMCYPVFYLNDLHSWMFFPTFYFIISFRGRIAVKEISASSSLLFIAAPTVLQLTKEASAMVETKEASAKVKPKKPMPWLKPKKPVPWLKPKKPVLWLKPKKPVPWLKPKQPESWLNPKSHCLQPLLLFFSLPAFIARSSLWLKNDLPSYFMLCCVAQIPFGSLLQYVCCTWFSALTTFSLGQLRSRAVAEPSRCRAQPKPLLLLVFREV